MEKIVGFVGYECEDIVLYLAKIISSFGKKVAIVDRTEQEMLMEVIDAPGNRENTAREGEFSGVWLTTQGVCKEEYDMIFMIFGYRLLHPKLYECGTLVMVTDGVPAHASMLRKIGHWDRKQCLLLRNLVPMKHTEKYLALLADNEKNYCEIPYDEQDIRMRYSLSSYAGCALKSLSAGMKKALSMLVIFLLPEYQERFVREAMKKM